MSNDFKYLIFIIYSSMLRIIYLFFFLFPVKKKKVCVRNYEGKGYGDNPKYIVKALLDKVDDIEVIWLVKEINEKKEKKNIKFVRINSLRSFYHMSTSKIWIANTRIPIYIKKKSSQTYIQTWHGGLGMKQIERQVEDKLSKNYIETAKNDSKNIDYLISNSIYRTELYKNYFWYSGSILEIGLPRNDLLMKENYRNPKIYEYLGLSNDVKLLIYAPTFRKNHDLHYYQLDFKHLIQSLHDKFKGDWKVLIRLHPIIAHYSYELTKDNQNVIDVSDYDDVYEILSVCDAMISDYSSIMFDFMVRNKPIFIYATDIEIYKKDRDFNIPFDSIPFPVSKSIEDLIDAINKYDINEKLKEFEIFKEKYGLKESGNASEYIRDLIINEMTKE